MRVGLSNSQNNVSFRADFRTPPRKLELIFELGEHVKDAFERDVPQIKKKCGNQSYIYSCQREYEAIPRMNKKNVLSHLTDNIHIIAHKRIGMGGLEQGPAVLVEHGIKFLEAAKKAQKLLDDILKNRSETSRYLD